MRPEVKILSILIYCFLLTPAPVHGQQTKDLGLKTVVIDPGHGGKDPGAPGKTSSTSEKHIVLKISKLLGQKIQAAYPDVKVVYTRNNDVFLELKERVNVAKRNNADLFISVHCNSNKSTQPYGASVHILGPKSKNSKNQKDYFAASMSVAQRENSVMLLEDDYKTSYQDFNPDSPESVISNRLLWMSNYENSLLFAAEYDAFIHKAPYRESRYTGIHQDVFYVLWAVGAPSALIEVGFLSNPQDYAVLSTKDGQDKIAQTLFDAFKNYKKKYDASVGAVSQISAEPEVAPSKSSSSVYYGIQIMGLGRQLTSNDPALKGLRGEMVKTEGSSVYKYVTAKSDSKEGAMSQLSTVRKKFPEAFLVRGEGSKVERIK